MKKTGFSGLFCALSVGALLVGCGGGEEAPVEDSCSTGETHAAIVTALAFTRAVEKGVAPGFDLDGMKSNGSDFVTCGKVDFTDEDGRTGIDNQLAALVPDVENLVGDAVDGLIQGSINDGILVILLEMENVDDLENDSCVNLSVQIGETKRPTLGTDGVIESYQTFELDPTAKRSHVTNARIENGVLETGPFPLAIPIAIFDVAFTINVQGARVRLAIDEEGKMEGYLGGGIIPDEIVEGVKEGDGLEDLIPQIRLVLDASTDLGYNEDTGLCEQLSATLAVSGAPAFIRR